MQAACPASHRTGAVARAVPIALASAIVAYRLVVDAAYSRIIAVSFGYQGFRDAPTAESLLVSWVFLLALLPLLLRVFRLETVSGQITTLVALISLVPSTTLIAHNPAYTGEYIVLLFVYWVLTLLAVLVIPAIRPFRQPLRSELPHLGALVALCATIIYLSWRFTGLRIHLGLFDVYELRAEARGYEVASVLAYLATMADNTLPILLAYYLRRRWIPVAAVVAVVILFNFGISATKQVLFLLVLGLASFTVREPARLNRRFLLALSVIIGAALSEKILFGTVFVADLSLYRLMTLPAHLHWVTYDFFQGREPLYLTQSALRFFFESPYRDNVQFLLGDFFIGDMTARANNGLFSDGYMNFGAVSVLFYPVLFVVLMKLLEGAAAGLSSGVQFMIVMSMAFVLLSVPLPTAVLTSGAGLLILLLSTMPRRDGARVDLPTAPA